MPHEARSQVTPAEIVDAILNEFNNQTLPGTFSLYVKNVFHVYLCEEDLRTVRSLERFLRDDIVRALDEEIRKLRKPVGGFPFLKSAPVGVKLPGPWIVEFHHNTDDDAAEARVTVTGAFAHEQSDDSGLDGDRTVRAQDAPVKGESTVRSHDSTAQPPASTVYARLTYEDNRGRQTFDVVKDVTRIGRDDPDFLLDVRLHTKSDVGREHLTIRRNAKTGRFTVIDSSKFGTWIDGVQISANTEVPLPTKAEINLANAINLTFKQIK